MATTRRNARSRAGVDADALNGSGGTEASRRRAGKRTDPDRLSIAEYRRKRDFRKTDEPAPTATAKVRSRTSKSSIFVVQEHHARRLHWDFRLEADGVLKSWAVPRTPTQEVGVRRLAVRTEDHPLAYADFAGTIPAGEYGAGEVIRWDHGTYTNLMAAKARPLTLAESIAQGHVEVELNGKRLKGKFTLVRMGEPSDKENWLLIKSRDGHAVGSPRAGHKTSDTLTERHGRFSDHVPSTTSDSQSSTPVEGQPILIPAEGAPQRPRFSHEDKVLFPEAGVTKGALLRYYELIAPKLLPHLRDRPVTLERLPDGLRDGAPHFWQKDAPAYYPAWIPRLAERRDADRVVRYPLCNDVETLLYLVNQAAVTLHPWFSRVGSLDRPDFVVFDLDPGGRPFTDVVAVAKALRKILDRDGVASYPKTSGKSGLHVLVAWQPPGDFAAAQRWAMGYARQVVAAMPGVATVERMKAKRRGRLYVDVMQNDRGKHAVPPYVVRATPLATVSTPLDWDEVAPRLDPRRFDILTAAKRFAKQGGDPFLPLVS